MFGEKMRSNSNFIFILLINISLIVFQTGCREASPKSSSSNKITSLISGSTFDWYDNRTQKSNKSYRTIRNDHSQREFVIIITKKDETIDLYSKWSNIKKEKLIKLNPGIAKNGIKDGDPFYLLLNSEELEEFTTNRNLHQLALKLESLKKPDIEKIITHTVKEKETITTILRKYPGTNLDLLEKINPDKYISNLMPHDVIKIPIMKKN